MLDMEKILIIKLSAFGDFIQAFGPIKAIRNHHPKAHITLLTAAPFESLARASGYCDDVIIDARPKMLDVAGWLRLRAQLIAVKAARVYDLMNNDRTALYFKIMRQSNAALEWVGTVPGASHYDRVSDKKTEHAITRHARLLSLAGISNVAYDDLHWVESDPSRFNLPHPYVLLMPGCAPGGYKKRWPADHYGALAQYLSARGLTPVIIGTEIENDLAETIQHHCPGAISLCGKTKILDLVGLARGAAGAIGNDTGTMHISGPTGCPLLVLFSSASDPVRHAPLGPSVRTYQVDDLKTLDVETVIDLLPPEFFRV